MDIARKFAIGIVMIIPTFVGGGAVWDIFHNWFAILVWVVIMAIIVGSIVKGKLLSAGS